VPLARGGQKRFDCSRRSLSNLDLGGFCGRHETPQKRRFDAGRRNSSAHASFNDLKPAPRLEITSITECWILRRRDRGH